MEKTYEVILLKVGKSEVSGNIYSTEVIEKTIERLKLRTAKYGNLLFGEYGLPHRRLNETPESYEKRFLTIDESNASHAIDTLTLEIKDGFLVGMCHTLGPLKALSDKLLESSQYHFAMRSRVQYKEGNTIQTEKLTVSHCEIITFDLVSDAA